MLDSIFHTTLKWLWNLIVGMKKLKFLSLWNIIAPQNICNSHMLFWIIVYLFSKISRRSMLYILVYSKTCLKQPLKKKSKMVFKTNYHLMHSAILSTFIKPPFAIKIFVLSIFEWLLKTGFGKFVTNQSSSGNVNICLIKKLKVQFFKSYGLQYSLLHTNK